MKLKFEKEQPDYKARSQGKPMFSMVMRIKSRVNVNPRTGCWNWTGSFRKDGYGKLLVGSKLDGSRRTVTASRASYETFVGKIPPGMVVCHKCDNPRCVNPDHLFVGTWKDNFDDMVRKGRRKQARGSRIASSKLTEADVRRIRQSGKTPQELADRYGVNVATVRKILSGASWKHVVLAPARRG